MRRKHISPELTYFRLIDLVRTLRRLGLISVHTRMEVRDKSIDFVARQQGRDIYDGTLRVSAGVAMTSSKGWLYAFRLLQMLIALELIGDDCVTTAAWALIKATRNCDR